MMKIMFYCQHILGIGHLIRSIEIVRGFGQDQVCFINGGQVIEGFPVPEGVELINIPAIKTDPEFQELYAVDPALDLEQVKELRTEQLLQAFDRFEPDVLLVELFPFGRRRFSFELIPLLERAQAAGTKIVSSLRDIVVTKQDRQRHEEKICRLMNQYFDMLLIHGDPNLIGIEASFSRTQDLNCEMHYTGYVVQPLPDPSATPSDLPLILVSAGGGRFGHELLECVAHASAYLEDTIPHHIQMFAGPFSPDAVYSRLQELASQRRNLTVERYTPNLLEYMRRAELSISMAGYNTTLNILSTGVRAMLLPFAGNGDQEQTLRSGRLEELGVVQVIRPAELTPERFAQKVIASLSQQPTPHSFDLQGVGKTVARVRSLAQQPAPTTIL
ncbi:MAG: glycosyltransferase family protein [Cyanophyceae cyanobacterium]